MIGQGTHEGSDSRHASPSREGLLDFWSAYSQAYDETRAALIEEARRLPSMRRVIDSISSEQLEEQGAHSHELLTRAMESGDWPPWLTELRRQGQFYAQAGVEFRAWFDVTGSFHRFVVPTLVQAYASDHERLTNALDAMNWYLELALGVIGEAYLEMKETLIAQQQLALIELSTPVLKIREGMLLLPVIGVLDTRRARMLTDQVLREIRAVRARAVVMDITGVAAVDTKVANHLLQTVAAARLMGAKVVVTGLSPEVAQTLVMLGVNLESVTTVGDLEGGIELAERYLLDRVQKPEPAGASPDEAGAPPHGFH